MRIPFGTLYLPTVRRCDTRMPLTLVVKGTLIRSDVFLPHEGSPFSF